MAYLAAVPKPLRAAAAAHAKADHAREALSWAIEGLILAGLLLAGPFTRIARALEGRVAPWLRDLVLALAFVFILSVLRAVLVAAAQDVWPALFGVSAKGLSDLMAGAVLETVIAGVALFGLLSAARAWPRGWWMVLSLGGGVFCLLVILAAPVTLQPVLRHDVAAPAQASGRFLAFARRGGLAARQLYVFANPDPTAVDAEGLGPWSHLAVSTAALKDPVPETFAALGHLLGHHRHKDLWSLALLEWSLWTALVFALAVLAQRAGALSARGEPVRRIDASALPLIGLMIWLAAPVQRLAFNAFDQAINYRADAYALALTADPDALCRWIMVDDRGEETDPGFVEGALFFDHPPLRPRLQAVVCGITSHPCLNGAFALGR